MTLYVSQQETQISNTDVWTLWEKAREGWVEKRALKHAYYHMWKRSLVQVQCMKEGNQSWCTWTSLRRGTGEGASGWGTQVHPWRINDNVWQRNDAKAETPVLCPPHAKSWLIGKDSDSGRDWGQEEKGTTEDEMAGWHQWLDGCESEWIPGVGDGQGGLECCNSWGFKESDTTEQLNWTELMAKATTIL